MFCLKTSFICSHSTWKVLLIAVYFAKLVVTKRSHDDEEIENPFRLPHTITPVHYQLTLLPVIEEKPRLCGHVWINVIANSSTNVIVLHGQILPVETVVYADDEHTDKDVEHTDKDVEHTDKNVEHTDKNVEHTDKDVEPTDKDEFRMLVERMCFSGILDTLESLSDDQPKKRDDEDISQSVHLNEDTEQMIIVLKEELIVGASYWIGILYLAEINDGDNIGFFRVQKKQEDNNCCRQRWIGSTQLEATHARKVFPCFDEPAFKATIELTLGHESSLKAISNMPLNSSTSLKTVDDWVWDTFEKTPIMSTYLLACVISELEHLETSYVSIDGRNVTLRLWTEKEKFSQLNLAYQLVPKIMETLENHLGIPYTLPKLDMVSLPGYDLARAMENWGLIVQSESTLLQESETNDPMQKAIFAITIVHEIAHQWFGNLVTSRWWSDIWFNEGLATLFENVVLNEIAPELGVDVITVLFFQQALFHDTLNISIPLNYPVELLPSIEHKFDGFAYAKASVIFRMVRAFVGQEAFKSGLHRYFSQFQFKAANSTDLWAILTQESHRTATLSPRKHVGRIMKTWSEQSGYPLIQVDRNPDGTIQLTQTPFIDSSNPLMDNFAETIAWWVPISMTTGADPKFSMADRVPVVWLTPKVPSAAIEGPNNTNTWILVNLQYSGYYRVNYDLLGWQLLSEQLMRNHTVIPVLNRAQLIDDVFTLSHIKILPYDVSLELIEYLGKAEEENFVRSVAVGHVGRIQQMMAIQELHDERLAAIVNIMMSHIVPSQNSESRNFYNSGEFDVKCHSREEQCVSRVLGLFHDHINGTLTLQQSSLMKKHFEDIWCTAIRYGGSSEWSYSWNSSIASSATLSTKRKILKAMTCTEDADSITQLLSRVFLPKINQEPIETSVILNSFAENSFARSLAMKFVMRNWAFLNKHFRNAPRMRDLLVAVTRYSSSVGELEKVNNFLEDKTKELGPGVIDLIIATISSNIRQIELQKIHLKYQSLIGERGNDLIHIDENLSPAL